MSSDSEPGATAHRIRRDVRPHPPPKARYTDSATASGRQGGQGAVGLMRARPNPGRAECVVAPSLTAFPRAPPESSFPPRQAVEESLDVSTRCNVRGGEQSKGAWERSSGMCSSGESEPGPWGYHVRLHTPPATQCASKTPRTLSR